MNYQKKSSRGSAHAIVTIGLVVALFGALGFIFWQNFIQQEPADQKTSGSTQKVATKTDDATKTAGKDSTPTYAYTDYRTDKRDTTGLSIVSASDVDKLAASDKLKNYLKAEVGKEVDSMGGGVKQTFTIDRVYGDYAAGPGLGAYSIWGPKAGTGEITTLASTQSLGMKCEALTAASVPQELVDGKCVTADWTLVDYNR